MEGLIFTLGVGLLRGIYWVASWVNPKAKAFREGRIRQADPLRSTFNGQNPRPLIWFHCASLGEFEQGRPVIEALKAARRDIRILLTFFSPSGYEVRKNYPLADHVFYLPWDTASNAEWFAHHVRPAVAVFVKYEFWYHYSRALKAHNIPLISISAIFRSTHIYFKPHGFAFRSTLRNFSYFFVQNHESLQRLTTIGISTAAVAGDTRFDRVAEAAAQKTDNAIASAFKNNRTVFVIGSAWAEDMKVLIPFMNATRGSLNFVVAPHEIEESFMAAIEKSFHGSSTRYTNPKELEKAELLIVDTVGLLAQLYRFGTYAFVGGGFKQGLHNTLEAACYGIPVFFGSNVPYDPYQEAIELVARGGAFAVASTDELTTAYDRLSRDPEAYRRAADNCRSYVQANRGATKIITDYLLKTLETWKAG